MNIFKKSENLQCKILSVIMIMIAQQSFAFINDAPNTVIAQQGITITGVVTDDTGFPLPGVNVVIKGTSTGLSTGPDGSYSITVPSGEIVLVFSYIGFINKEMVVGNQRSINVTLLEDVRQIEEVVVVGFGTQKKVNLTGAVGTASSVALESRPVMTAGQALQGVVPGLNITQNRGMLEDRPSINVRGVATIGQGSSGNPLILIDGMEADINTLNPQDIESISVLKDAASSSIYGSRAPFGVILVTTKRGKTGKPVFSYNNNFRWSDPVLLPELADSYTFATYFNDAATNGGQGAQFSPEHLQRIKDFQAGTLKATVPINSANPTIWADGYLAGNDNVDWFRALFRSWEFSQDHNLSVSGGTDAVNYYLSAGLVDQNGLMVFNQDFYKRFNVTSKVEIKITDWLNLNYNLRFIRDDYERPSYLRNDLFQQLGRQAWPTLPLYDPNGYLYDEPSPALSLRDGGRGIWQTDRVSQQAQFVLEPIANWRTFIEFNYNIENEHQYWNLQQTFNHDVSGNPYVFNTSSEVYERNRKDNYYNLKIYSEYSKNLSSGHNFKGMAGFETENFKRFDFNLRRIGIIVPELPVVDLTTGLDAQGNVQSPSVNGAYEKWATTGFFGRINYDYQSKYLAEFNLRYDGSSRFRSNNRWGLFPSVSIGWNVAREEFWSSLSSYVEMLKIRASYGELGNQNTESYYPTYQVLTAATADGNWLVDSKKPNTARSPSLISSTLTWERVQTRNIGLDFGALKYRLTGSFDYFIRYTLDMVGPAPQLPATLGTDVPRTNNTDLKTSGFELSLGWQDRLKNGLAYSVKLSLADTKTEITRYPNVTGAFGNNIYREGQIMGEIWGYTTKGIAKTQQEMDGYLASLPNGGQAAIGSQWGAGDIMYVDVNGDGKIDGGASTIFDHGDRTIIGNSRARYSFGFDLTADYKGIDFRAFFQGIGKRDYWNGNYFFFGAYSGGVWSSTCMIPHLDYFRNDPDHLLGENLDSYFARPLFNSGRNMQAQTRYLQNAAYIRLKNIQLGYTLPASVVSKTFLSKLRLYVSGENLWTGSKMFKVFDPETVDGGWNGNVYPLCKTLSFGLNINF